MLRPKSKLQTTDAERHLMIFLILEPSSLSIEVVSLTKDRSGSTTTTTTKDMQMHAKQH